MKIVLKKLMLLLMMGGSLSYMGCSKDEEPVNPADLQPGIESVSPSEGNIGTELTIKGSNFAKGATVLVGSVPAGTIKVVSSTSITAKVPAGVPFNTLLSVTVKNTGGKSDVAEDAFTALAGTPVVASVTPAEGMIGTEITINGSDFDPEAVVLVDGVTATTVSVTSSSSITAIVPGGIQVNILVPVTVRNPSGAEGTLADAFKAIHPVIESVTPSEGSIGTEIHITGGNFETGAVVMVGEVLATVVEVVSSTSIYALVPEGIPTKTLLSVTVKNPNGADGTFANAYTAIDPVLSYVNSATKPSGNIGSTVILEGTAFGDIQGSGKILFSDGVGGTIEAIIASPDDWTETFIVTTVPSGAQNGPVVVTTGVGTSNALQFTVTSNAAFSPSTIRWTLTTDLPVAVSGHSALYVPIDDASGVTQQFVHVTGGKNSAATALDQVIYGQINADGTISSWNQTSTLPEARAFHATIAATPFNSKAAGSGYLYVLGGTNAAGEAMATVSVASLNSNGSVGAWTSATPLPMPLHSMGAAIFRNTIYISGGATTGNVPVDKVYKATISADGTLSEWKELSSLPSARAYHGFITFGAYLYAVGGETGTIAPDATTSGTQLVDVVYAKIDLRTGDLAQQAWSVNANSLQKARSKHTTLAVGGNMFVSSGLYSGAAQGSSENVYAQILSDGTVGSFAGATGSNTIFSQGGSNLFNLAGISYIDANGVAHVMILGGDDLNNPGTKKAKVLFY